MRRRNIGVSVLFILLFLLFLGIMIYPFLAQIYNESGQKQASVAYQQDVDALPQEKREEEKRKAQEYNARLATGLGSPIEDAFQMTEAEEREEDNGKAPFVEREYDTLLKTREDGAMGRIEIPQIGADLVIYHGTDSEVLEKGAGHLEGSSLPVGGESTHTCISAHRGLSGKRLFTDLDQMEVGDIFYLHVLGETLCYQVEKIYTILPQETKQLSIEKGKDMATLITCTPYGINTHRLCVEGIRIPYDEQAALEAQSQAKDRVWMRWMKSWLWLPVSILLTVVMSALVFRYNRRGCE